MPKSAGPKWCGWRKITPTQTRWRWIGERPERGRTIGLPRKSKNACWKPASGCVSPVRWASSVHWPSIDKWRNGSVRACRVHKRTKVPSTGWYLPEVLNVTEDMDCVDFIENLRLEGHNRPVHILNIVSVHGRLAGSFPTTAMSATHVMESLWSHWTTHGFPRYVQFDNGSVFAGAPKPGCAQIFNANG